MYTTALLLENWFQDLFCPVYHKHSPVNSSMFADSNLPSGRLPSVSSNFFPVTITSLVPQVKPVYTFQIFAFSIITVLEKQ